jgi:radical SAM superfamily enzyme YgiQ (UPF0313 family)
MTANNGYEEHSQKQRRRILLVNPPYRRLFKDTFSLTKYPLSLGYLAGTIKEETDWDVMVYNADFSPTAEDVTVSYLAGPGFENYQRNLKDLSTRAWRELKATIEDYEPEIIGIYTCASNSTSAAVTASLAKEINKHIVVVVGGPHSTAAGQETLIDLNIDVAVKGEGEKTIVDLLNATAHVESFASVKGIIYREHDQLTETPGRELAADLDHLRFPYKYAREVLKDYEKYPKSAFNVIMVSRGCPYDCFFCGSRSIWNRIARYRSVANVVDEMKSLMNIGLKSFEFNDDTFTLNREYTCELCDALIQECPGISWTCETRVDRVDEQLVALMKRAGCRAIYLGVESGNNAILKQMRKGTTLAEAVQATEMVRKHGIRVRANFLVGSPWETEDTLNDTFRAMRAIRATIGYSIFTPYPGTEAFEYCAKAGLIEQGYDVSLYNHQSPENCFCMNIPKERFRELASKIENYVDKHNTREYLLSLDIVNALKSYGNSHSSKSLPSMIRAIIRHCRWLLRGMT